MGAPVQRGDIGESITGTKAPGFDGSQLCAQVDPELFFYESRAEMGEKVPKAKKICNECMFTKPCLDYALANDVQGVWGATTYSERKKLRKEFGLPRPKPMSSYIDDIIKKMTK